MSVERGGGDSGGVYTKRKINVGLTLVHNLRRWYNVKPKFIQRIVSAGQCVCMVGGLSQGSRVVRLLQIEYSRATTDIFDRLLYSLQMSHFTDTKFL